MIKDDSHAVMLDSFLAPITLNFKELLNRPGTLREIGKAIRADIVNSWESHEFVQLDFENETVASGSLFDEIAKLFLEFPKDEVKRRLRLVNIDPLDERLMVHLAKLRMAKKKKSELA